MLADPLAIINAIAAALEALAVAVTLIFVIRQATATNDSVVQLKRELKLTTLAGRKSLANEINLLAMQDRELAQALGYTKTELFAFMILHDCEQRFLMWQEGLITEFNWQCERQVIVKAMKYSFIHNMWERIKCEFQPEFVEYASNFLPEQNHSHSTAQPAVQPDAGGQRIDSG